MTLKAKSEQLAATQKKVADILEAAKTKDGGLDFSGVKEHGIDGDNAKAVEVLRNFNAELAEIGTEVTAAKEAEALAAASKAYGDMLATPAAGTPAVPGATERGAGNPLAFKSIGEMITDSAAVKNFGRGQGVGPVAELDLGNTGIKTLMEASAGWAPEAIRTGKVVESAQRPVQVLDIIPTTTTGQNAVVYMSETTFTNNAAEAAEGGSYGESALALTEVSSPVQKIAVFLPVTDEQLEDVSQLQGYINNRLGFMLRQRLDGQVLNGDGTSPNLSGILDRSGIQTQAKGADTTLDAVFKAITKVRATGRANADAVVMESTDWQDIRLLRTADGIYIMGNPADSGPDRIWGLRLVISDALTTGTAIVGDFGMYSELAVRRNVAVQVSNSHSDYFVKGKQAIRADMRAAFQVYRDAAFCSVTGI